MHLMPVAHCRPLFVIWTDWINNIRKVIQGVLSSKIFSVLTCMLAWFHHGFQFCLCYILGSSFLGLSLLGEKTCHPWCLKLFRNLIEVPTQLRKQGLAHGSWCLVNMWPWYLEAGSNWSIWSAPGYHNQWYGNFRGAFSITAHPGLLTLKFKQSKSSRFWVYVLPNSWWKEYK